MSRQATQTRPCMEALEDRLLLSTTVTYTPTSIAIVGDTTKPGQISVSGNVGGNYSVTVAGETPVIKGTSPAVSSKVSISVSAGNAGRIVSITPTNAKNVTVNGGKGNDNITVGNNVFAGNVTINGGDGINTLTVAFVDIAGSVTIHSGKDGDLITVRSTTYIRGNTTINAGDGGNHVAVENATTSGKLTITGGKDVDEVILGSGNPTHLLGNGSIDTKAGNDRIYLNQGTYGSVPGVGKAPTTFKITAGDGNDDIRIGGATTVGAVVFAGNVILNAGAGDDTLGIANSGLATTVDFEKAATILLGTGDDFLQIASFHDSNNVLFIGNAAIDLGSSLASGLGDRFGVSVSNTSQLAFSGSKNTINLGSGIKNVATPLPGIRANSIYLGVGSHTEIKAANGATVSSALKTAILKGLDTTADGVGVLISLV